MNKRCTECGSHSIIRGESLCEDCKPETKPWFVPDAAETCPKCYAIICVCGNEPMRRYDVTLNTPKTETHVYCIIRNIEAATTDDASDAALRMMAVPSMWALYNVQPSKVP